MGDAQRVELVSAITSRAISSNERSRLAPCGDSAADGFQDICVQFPAASRVGKNRSANRACIDARPGFVRGASEYLSGRADDRLLGLAGWLFVVQQGEWFLAAAAGQSAPARV